MTPAEYLQLKAFARVDGLLLALLWTAGFACYMIGLSNPFYGMLALLVLVVSPFFVARRLKRFRDEDLGGIISLMRGWAFVILVFFYGAILLALVQYAYFAFMDKGYMMASFQSALSQPEAKQMIESYGMSETMSESLTMLASMRPIDYALNILTLNISAGIIVGLPIAALLKKGK